MSYLVLARKFRPQNFGSVSGQEQVTRTLMNSIERDKVSHAYLFCGPRGVGKTSVARVFSKALNCVRGPTREPCLTCANCREIAEGRSMAVLEIDGASHNSVDNVRELIETLHAVPAPGSRYKVYIIDEVHMLSTAAFNALLKSLEEPPPHTIFILATTEVHKIPATVISRCQRHDFRAISPALIEDRLREIAVVEKLLIEDEALSMIARLSDGSMRDAQSLLDRVQAFCADKITAVEASRVLGVAERGKLMSLSGSVLRHESTAVIPQLQEVFSSGIDVRLFLDEFVSHWHDLLVAKHGGAAALTALHLAPAISAELLSQVKETSSPDLQDLVQLAREGADNARRSAYPKHALEALLVRMASREPVKDLAELIASVSGGPSSGGGPAGSKPKVTPLRPQLSEQTPAQLSSAAPLQTGAADKNNSEGLEWRAFVNHVGRSASPMLFEYLKRLSVEEFKPGVLAVQGVKTATEYLESNREKLLTQLNQFHVMPKWEIRCTATNAVEAGKTILDAERGARAAEQREALRDAANHPAIEQLRKAFPGSTLQKPKAVGNS